ncbi:hypothetical protein BC831DRAFT_548758 [Entophlyctis helioformis]|nr:hypothetical protein BC831DRAFT_548758 [Entophlyctis helioformis]
MLDLGQRTTFVGAAATRAEAAAASDTGTSHDSVPVQVSATQFDLLQPYRQVLAAKRFWREFFLFDRLQHKNALQHRSSVHRRKAVQVQRIVRRLKELELETLLPERAKATTKASAPSKSGTLSREKQSVHVFPILLRLVGGYALLRKLIDSIEEAYLAYHMVASQTYFMSTSLTFCAILARMHFLVKHELKELEGLYDLVWSWAQTVDEIHLPTYAAHIEAAVGLFPRRHG